MENKIVVVDDEPVMAKALKRQLRDEPFDTIRDAFHYSNALRGLNAHPCDICGQKVPSRQIRIHDSLNMCPRCRNWYELLPGVLIESLRRMIIGNVL